MKCSKQYSYSITSSARASTRSVRLSNQALFAVFRLMVRLNSVGCSTGRSGWLRASQNLDRHNRLRTQQKQIRETAHGTLRAITQTFASLPYIVGSNAASIRPRFRAVAGRERLGLNIQRIHAVLEAREHDDHHAAADFEQVDASRPAFQQQRTSETSAGVPRLLKLTINAKRRRPGRASPKFQALAGKFRRLVRQASNIATWPRRLATRPLATGSPAVEDDWNAYGVDRLCNYCRPRM